MAPWLSLRSPLASRNLRLCDLPGQLQLRMLASSRVLGNCVASAEHVQARAKVGLISTRFSSVTMEQRHGQYTITERSTNGLGSSVTTSRPASFEAIIRRLCCPTRGAFRHHRVVQSTASVARSMVGSRSAPSTTSTTLKTVDLAADSHSACSTHRTPTETLGAMSVRTNASVPSVRARGVVRLERAARGKLPSGDDRAGNRVGD